ncbi:MAG: tetratricopeptide repeat protein [Saprospiraceae bacterium]
MKRSKNPKEAASTVSNWDVNDAISSTIQERKFVFAGLLAVLFLGIVLYLNSFAGSFHFDDEESVVANLAIRDLSNWKVLWSQYQSRFFAYLTFAINYHYGALNVWGYHMVNVLIHLINAALVYWITLQLFSTDSMKSNDIVRHKYAIALFVALLFVSHPLATQSVTYLVQRMASLAALFYMLSVALYLKGRLLSNSSIKYFYFTLAVVVGLMSFFTKENAFSLPVAIVMIEIVFFQKMILTIDLKDRRIWLLIGAIGSLFLVFFLRFSTSIFNPIPPAHGHTYTVSSITYLLTQFSVILKYIQLLILPWQQNLDYDYPLSASFFEIKTMGSFLILCGLLFSAIYWYRAHRLITFGILWFFIPIAIESSIIPIEDLIFEHRTYLPSLGFFIIFVYSIYTFVYPKYRLLALAILLCSIGFNSIKTIERNAIWKDELTLWTDVAAKSPNKARPQVKLGGIYSNKNQWDKAIAHFSKAIEINPNFTEAYNNRGAVYWSQEKWDKAVGDYTKAIELNPKFSPAYFNRGISYTRLGLNDKALADLSSAVEINPQYAEAYYNRGLIKDRPGNWSEAAADYSLAISVDSNYSKAYYNRGICNGNLGNLDQSIADFTKTMELDPKNRNAVYNRANTFGMQNQWEKAINDYNSTIVMDSGYTAAYINRGVAFGKLGQWELALKDYTKAIQLEPNNSVAKYNVAFASMKIKTQNK